MLTVMVGVAEQRGRGVLAQIGGFHLGADAIDTPDKT